MKKFKMQGIKKEENIPFKILTALIIAGTSGEGAFWMYFSLGVFPIAFNIFVASIFATLVGLYLLGK